MTAFVRHDQTLEYRADIVCDSVNPAGTRLTSVILRYPLFVHAEVLTHRVLARNGASSRALSRASRRKEAVILPLHWGAEQRGMSADHELSKESIEYCMQRWEEVMAYAHAAHEDFERVGLHKQTANRILNSFLPMETLITATEAGWVSFLQQRTADDVQPELRYVARMLLKNVAVAVPTELGWGEVHMPFSDDIRDHPEAPLVSAGRCARVSYLNHERGGIPEYDVRLARRLIRDGHWSPFEHVAFADEAAEVSGCFRGGWRQLRKAYEPKGPTTFAELLAA